MHTAHLLWQQYLWAAVNRLASVHNDVTQGVVAIQLDCVKLSQLDGVEAAYGGHAGAHVKPETTKRMIVSKMPMRRVSLAEEREAT